jgi:hypothetical protein
MADGFLQKSKYGEDYLGEVLGENDFRQLVIQFSGSSHSGFVHFCEVLSGKGNRRGFR